MNPQPRDRRVAERRVANQPQGWPPPVGSAVTSVLIVRAWRERPGPDGLVIRMLGRGDVAQAVERGVSVRSVDEAVDFVRLWLTDVTPDETAVTGQ
jgi:hypothetical protein